jgi:hypothetical protein
MPKQPKKIRDRELITDYFVSIRKAEEIIAEGTIRQISITRGASQKALDLLDSNRITYAVIVDRSKVPGVSAKPQKLVNSAISHEQIVHSLASTLSRLGFPARIKDFYYSGAELTCEIEDFQIPRFWEEMNTLKNNFSKKYEANDRD